MLTFENQLTTDEKVTVAGKEIILRKNPRYGYWRIHLEHGQIPERLQSAYMSRQDAVRAATGYYASEDSRWAKRQSPKAKEKVNEVRKEMGLEEK